MSLESFSTTDIGLVDQNRNEHRQSIDDLNDIYQFADQLKATINYYDHPTHSNMSDNLSQIETSNTEYNGISYSAD